MLFLIKDAKMIYNTEDIAAVATEERGFFCVDCLGNEDYSKIDGVVTLYTQDDIINDDEHIFKCDKCGKIL